MKSENFRWSYCFTLYRNVNPNSCLNNSMTKLVETAFPLGETKFPLSDSPKTISKHQNVQRNNPFR